jgi:putative phosphoribosyl transferase
MPAPRYRDRTEAGEVLAALLADAPPRRPVVLALPRGGLPVAAPVAARLGAPLGLVLVRKIGVPGQPELAAGAVADAPGGEVVVWNPDVLAALGLREGDLAATLAAERAEIAARRARWLAGCPAPHLAGATAIVIDDGLATGATARAALAAVRAARPAAVILAVPVAAREALAAVGPLADRIVCPHVPEPFVAVGAHYRSFPQVAEAEVGRILAATAR